MKTRTIVKHIDEDFEAKHEGMIVECTKASFGLYIVGKLYVVARYVSDTDYTSDYFNTSLIDFETGEETGKNGLSAEFVVPEKSQFQLAFRF